ncbi:MAG: adenylate cyclase [Planctomycetota bacterium]|jgi:adenylate cyclase
MPASNTGHEGQRFEVNRAVIMADIVGSTALYEQLGDLRARELVSQGLEMMELTVTSHAGRLIKSLGDGILACFEGPEATTAALAISERIGALLLEARVGVHFGSVIEDGGDLFGDTVNTAARLASAARPSEVLVSRQVWDQLPADIRDLGRFISPISVKGKRDPVEVFSILTNENESFQTIGIGADSEQPVLGAGSIELAFRGQSWLLEGPGSLLIGRGCECDVVVDYEQTSRTHLQVSYRAPVFMLTDSSTNGTTVVHDSGAPVLIHRRDTVLFGKGWIYPGSIPGRPDSPAIEYQID